MRTFKIAAGILITVIVSLVTIWYFQDTPLLSPLTELTTFKFISHVTPSSKGKIVYGFLPYWLLDEAQPHPELTNVAYFGLTIGSDGRIMSTTEDGTLEPGYNHLDSDELLEFDSQIETMGGKSEIVLAQFNNDDIVALLTNPRATENLIQSLDSILLAYPVNGVNIDIEYTGEVTDSLRNKLTQFVTVINQHLDQTYTDVTLSIDMYAGATGQNQLWDVAAIAPQVDYIIIMAYDFHQRSSPMAGPVAPLFGGAEFWDSDINQHLAKFVSMVPSNKLLLGVPFYGYEWQTTSREAQAHTFPNTGSTASYERVQELLSQRDTLQVEQHWNENALTPYLSYVEDGKFYVVYYEDSRSLSYKLDYVNQANLGGIAIWALGYEGLNNELWEVIEQKL